MEPKFFATPAAFRKWLEKNHATKKELIVGFYKKDSGKKSMSWAESVDEALCFGWIDGVRKSLDDDSYTIRFTPRNPKSIWSAVNLRNVKRLIDEGKMQPAGLAVYEARDPKKAQGYTYGHAAVTFDPASERLFRSKAKAWKFFQAQPPGYKKVTMRWVMNAKQQATKDKRLTRLIEVSAAGTRLNLVKPFDTPA